ncbi:hypothetical protein Tcan_07899 [Toxocara canis]|uniref:Uncharacterized protein n=1 Tax=Toxocara canis TaxID=6265 RepID=A0A0B2W6N3_TOXCA|nr:hypothetical protein Tcan_07899 [Toxocara canis]
MWLVFSCCFIVVVGEYFEKRIEFEIPNEGDVGKVDVVVDKHVQVSQSLALDCADVLNISYPYFDFDITTGMLGICFVRSKCRHLLEAIQNSVFRNHSLTKQPPYFYLVLSDPELPTLVDVVVDKHVQVSQSLALDCADVLNISYPYFDFDITTGMLGICFVRSKCRHLLEAIQNSVFRNHSLTKQPPYFYLVLSDPELPTLHIGKWLFCRLRSAQLQTKSKTNIHVEWRMQCSRSEMMKKEYIKTMRTCGIWIQGFVDVGEDSVEDSDNLLEGRQSTVVSEVKSFEMHKRHKKPISSSDSDTNKQTMFHRLVVNFKYIFW